MNAGALESNRAEIKAARDAWIKARDSYRHMQDIDSPERRSVPACVEHDAALKAEQIRTLDAWQKLVQECGA